MVLLDQLKNNPSLWWDWSGQISSVIPTCHRLSGAIESFKVSQDEKELLRLQVCYFNFQYAGALEPGLREAASRGKIFFLNLCLGLTDWLFATFISNVFRFQIFKEKKQNDKQWIVLSFAISENINQNLN